MQKITKNQKLFLWKDQQNDRPLDHEKGDSTKN